MKCLRYDRSRLDIVVCTLGRGARNESDVKTSQLHIVTLAATAFDTPLSRRDVGCCSLNADFSCFPLFFYLNLPQLLPFTPKG